MELQELLGGADRTRVAAGLETALMEDGYVLLRGPELACVARALESWTRFAALPLDVRQRFHNSVREGDRKGGWMLMREHPVYTSHMAADEVESPEPKQEYGATIDMGGTLWPDDEVAPGFAADAADVAALLDRVGRALLRGFAGVLGENPDFLAYEPGYFAFKHYPGKTPGASDEDGLQEHSDAVVFTVLSQSCESLMIRGRDNQWITAPADPGNALLVIPGDWMELFTNGRIPAVRHRVTETPQARTSLAFFQNVETMPVRPLPKFVGDGVEARYPTVMSDIDYVGGESGVPRWKTAVVS